MPVTINWEINPLAVVTLVTSLVTVVAFWVRSSDAAAQARTEAQDARKRADAAHESIAMLQASLAAYRETQAERLVSREVLREVEDRLTGSIERLGDRLDALVKELVSRGRDNRSSN